jgi:N utilization substance protein A
MVDDHNKSMDVIVPDDQLSLAIGKKGQNVRLAVQLSRWKIDIKSESLMAQVQEELAEALQAVEGAGEHEAKILLDHGVASLEELEGAQTELLASLPGINEEGAAAIKLRAGELYAAKLKREREEAAAAAAAAAEEEAAATPAARKAEAEAAAGEEADETTAESDATATAGQGTEEPTSGP